MTVVFAWVSLAIAAVALVSAGVLEMLMLRERIDFLDRSLARAWRQIDVLTAAPRVRRDPRVDKGLPRMPRRDPPKG